MSALVVSPYRKRRIAMLVGVAGLAGFGFFLYISFAGSGLFQIGSQTVTAVFGDGLNLIPRTSEVRVAGLPVGKVESVQLKGGDVVVTMQIDGDVDLRADATARLRLKSLLGERYVDLHPGNAAKPLDGPIIDTVDGPTFTNLAAGGPESANLYEDLGGDLIEGRVEEVAQRIVDESDRVEKQVRDLRAATEALVAGQESFLVTIDDIAALTSALVATSNDIGRLLDAADGVQRRLEATQAVAVVAYMRADTAVKILRAVIDHNAAALDSAVAAFEQVIEQGIEAFRLFRAGATIPVNVFGLGPLLARDVRPPGASGFPPAPQFSVPEGTKAPWQG